jgi:hypothetical protein
MSGDIYMDVSYHLKSQARFAFLLPIFSMVGNAWNSPSYRSYEHREMHPPSKGKTQLAVEGDSRII